MYEVWSLADNDRHLQARFRYLHDAVRYLRAHDAALNLGIRDPQGQWVAVARRSDADTDPPPGSSASAPPRGDGASPSGRSSRPPLPERGPRIPSRPPASAPRPAWVVSSGSEGPRSNVFPDDPSGPGTKRAR